MSEYDSWTRKYVKEVGDLGVLDGVLILVGVGPMRAAKVAGRLGGVVSGV